MKTTAPSMKTIKYKGAIYVEATHPLSCNKDGEKTSIDLRDIRRCNQGKKTSRGWGRGHWWDKTDGKSIEPGHDWPTGANYSNGICPAHKTKQ